MHVISARALRELAAEEEISLRVRGACMSPHVGNGDVVRVRRRRVYLPGDVIVFRTSAGDLAAHRLLGWRPAGFVTRGDTCVVHDAPVRREEIVGRVQMRVSYRLRVRALAEFARIVVRRLFR